MHAFLLVTAHPSEAGHVATAARLLAGVVHAAILGAGPYDVLLDVRAGSFADLGRTMETVRGLPGVGNAVACTHA